MDRAQLLFFNPTSITPLLLVMILAFVCGFVKGKKGRVATQ